MGVVTEQQIIDKYLGIPYLHAGRTLAGLDCWGLIKCIYADVGHELFDVKDYDKHWAKHGDNYFAENYHSNWVRVDDYRLLDVLLFRNGGGVMTHAGVYLSDGRFIHTSRAGTVISNLGDWFKKLANGYRLKQ